MSEQIHSLSVASSKAIRRGATGVGIVVRHGGTGTKRGPVIEEVSEAHASIPTSDAESFAILRALEFALEEGYVRVQVWSSVNDLRRSIRKEHRAEKKAEDPLRAHILELARRFTWVDFRFVPRRKNQTARLLAREAREALACTGEPASNRRGNPPRFAEETAPASGSPYDEDGPESIPY